MIIYARVFAMIIYARVFAMIIYARVYAMIIPTYVNVIQISVYICIRIYIYIYIHSDITFAYYTPTCTHPLSHTHSVYMHPGHAHIPIHANWERSYVPRVLCSPGPMFPGPMFPGSHVPRVLCSPGPMFGGGRLSICNELGSVSGANITQQWTNTNR